MWPHLEIASLQRQLVEMRSYKTIRVPYSNVTGVLIKRLPRGDRHTLGKHYVTTLARIGVMQLQAKEHQKLLVNPQILGIYKEVSLHMSEGEPPCYNLEFGLQASRVIKPYVSVVFNRLL